MSGHWFSYEMHMTKASLLSVLVICICLVLMAACTTTKVFASEQKFSFSVMADPRSQGDSWKNALLEIRDRNSNQEKEFTRSELVVVAGDMDPLVSRHEDFQHVFVKEDTRPVFLPVIGNHEFKNGGVHFRHARNVLIPSIPRVVRRHATSCDYYLDHKNIRIIAIDGYTDLGNDGVLNDKGKRWVEQVIKETPGAIDHIFIFFHEPAFPRFRHVGDSFDQNPERRNEFWRMLLEYGDRVRAVFVGHTHSYYRLRVLDPAGIAANDPNAFPDEGGGLYQVDVGAAGTGAVNTIVQVQVEGKNLFFSVLQAENGANKLFKEIDKWDMVYFP